MIINENYKIESDTLNVTLSHRSTGKKKWIPIGYFSEPYNALDYLLKNEIMGTGMPDLKTVVEKQKELYQLIRTLKRLPDIVQCLPRVTKSKKQGNQSSARCHSPRQCCIKGE